MKYSAILILAVMLSFYVGCDLPPESKSTRKKHVYVEHAKFEVGQMVQIVVDGRKAQIEGIAGGFQKLWLEETATEYIHHESEPQYYVLYCVDNLATRTRTCSTDEPIKSTVYDKMYVYEHQIEAISKTK